jgi:glycosyltransferase involved in cell wall biosynthesis
MNRRKEKPRIALFGMGTLGGLDLWQGVPVLVDLFSKLSADYEIVFYSLSPIDVRNVPAGISARQPISWRIPSIFKYLLLVGRCLCDHYLNRQFSLLFSVSVNPTGRWAVLVARILKRPIIVQLITLEVGAMPEINIKGFLIPRFRKIILSVCKKADALVSVSEYQRKIALANLPFSKEITDLPLRINSNVFKYKMRHISLPVQFIQIAFYSPIKDQDTMFAAFAKVVEQIDCHLTVIGNNFDVPKVHKLLSDLNITDKVTFTGFVKNSELFKYLDAAHILLHTARFETGCAVIQEAMASGVAVGGTRVGLLSDIGDDYAIIVPPGDSMQLAKKIIQLVNDPTLYASITKDAYNWITTHDAEWSYRNYRSFIEGVLSRNKKSYF